MSELRRFLRLRKEYRVEYGPFPLSGRDGELQSSLIRNIGGGGLQFYSPESFPEGRQLILRIFISGWRQEGEEMVEAEGAETLVTAIAQVKRTQFDPDKDSYLVAVEFLGRILP